ncbi:MAG: hypothetical protein CMI16_05600 [Opitutaceae bacterium]|nr:hypothetical protein [Opitutaceae bacterium]|tara:strand:- start:5630 stop:5956 length:327 start_codon:yes stop_codon:yes gene_type:complete
MAALGGKKFIKKSSSYSLNNIEDYAVYLHVVHGKDPGYTQALAAAMALYPDLEFRYDAAINKAYRHALTKRQNIELKQISLHYFSHTASASSLYVCTDQVVHAAFGKL